MNTYFVYVLQSIHFSKTYVGITNDLERRLTQHNNGYYPYTKRYMPWQIIYKESYNDREEARVREKYLKSCVGRKFIKKTLFR